MPTPENVRINFDPYPEQRDVLTSDARFRVVAAGRRSGKTLMAAAATVGRAAESDGDWRGYWVGAEHHHAETAFELIDGVLPEAAVERRNQSPPRLIELYNGATIEFHTAGGGALVSIGLDWSVLDEAGKPAFPERTWTQELRPALSDREGETMFISTPEGKDWFHDWWQRGQSADHPEVASWRWATYANPHVPDSEVDDAKAELPERVFEQEYLAAFRDETGGVFAVGDASAAYTPPDGPDPHPDAEPPYRLAVDLARHEDYLAIIGLGAAGRVSHLTRERGMTWRQVQRKVEQAAAAHDDPPVAVDATRDNKLVADLEAAGVDVRPVTFSASRKRTLVENLAAGMEAGDVVVPEDTILASELAVFEYETTRAGNVRYGAPQGHHDDTVDALAMAYDLPVEAPGDGVATVSLGSDTDHRSGVDLDAAVADQLRERENTWK